MIGFGMWLVIASRRIYPPGSTFKPNTTFTSGQRANAV
jgi:hypothetical protein